MNIAVRFFGYEIGRDDHPTWNVKYLSAVTYRNAVGQVKSRFHVIGELSIFVAEIGQAVGRVERGLFVRMPDPAPNTLLTPTGSKGQML